MKIHPYVEGDKVMEKQEDDTSAKTEGNTSWPYMSVSSLSKAFLTKLATAGVIWGWGYMNWSIAWLIAPIMMAVWKSEWRKDNELKTAVAQASTLVLEKEMISNRVHELPSWVYFPDFDRAEWLNRILNKVWPSANHFARDLFKSTIEPAVVESLARYKVKGFQFGRLVLGRIPPTVYGIKVYDKNTSRTEIIMDVDILYAGDCDINFSVGNFKGGIKDFQIRGMVRVIMKPMIPVMPLIGGLQIFFLNNPTLNFNLVGAVDILDLPGFNDILRKTIAEQVAAIMVLPNKLVIPLSQEIPAEHLKIPEPEGVLRIHVVQAKHLMKKDIGMLGKGKSDPYAVINIGAQEFRTKTIDNTVDPKWDYWCECVVSSAIAQQLTILVWDYDDTKGDESLGRATIEVGRVKKKGTIDTWLALEFAKHGMVHLRLSWLRLSKNMEDLKAALIETQELRVTSMSTALLIVYIDSAKNLPCARGTKQPDVYLEASVDNKSERTVTLPRSCDPIWEKGFTFLVANPETSVLNVKIFDEKTTLLLGEMSYKISLLSEKKDLSVSQQPYDLSKAAADSKLVMSLSLFILKYQEPVSGSSNGEGDGDGDGDARDEIDDNINEEEDINEITKRIERQESNVSSVSSNSALPSVSKKQGGSKDLPSVVTSIPNAIPESQSSAGAEEPVALVDRDYALSSSPGGGGGGGGGGGDSRGSESNSGLIHRHPSTTSSLGVSNLGRIQLTLRYSVPRQRLEIIVHRIANLPLPHNDASNIPDPYVKLYLLPDKYKETKRKTAVIKDNCNPTFDEHFEYIVSQGDVNSRILQITVCTQKAWLSTSSNVMGQVHLDLGQLDLTEALTSWYDLSPGSKD